MLSHSDTSATTILAEKSKTAKNNLEFYYFSPLSIYAKNKVTGEMYALDPQIDPTEELFGTMSKEEVIKTLQSQRERIPKIFQLEKEEIIKYKQSDAFYIYKNSQDFLNTNALPVNGNRVFVDGNVEP